MANFPLIAVGTYEEFVLGYKPKIDDAKGVKYKLIETFATHSHQASVRCVAANGQFMASSGADEYINIYDMISMKILTVINYHNATVTCLEFTPDGSHLVTANQNGDIAIFRCKDWALVKLWKAAHKHSNGVTSVSVHPTGSLLLTSGADNIVRFWNLIKGRMAYATNFSKKCSVGCSLNFGLWSNTGKLYAICIGNKLEVYKTESAAIIYEINCSTKITCATFAKNTLICVGTEDGTLEIHSSVQKQLLTKEKSHNCRLKCISSFTNNYIKNEENKIEHYLVTADSKGVIKLWCLKKKKNNCFLKVKGEVDCDCRITSLTKVLSKVVKEEKVVDVLNKSSDDVIQHDEKNKSHNTFKSKKKLIDRPKSNACEVKSKRKRAFSESKINKKKFKLNGSESFKKSKTKNLSKSFTLGSKKLKTPGKFTA